MGISSSSTVPGLFGRDAVISMGDSEPQTPTLDSGTIRERSFGSHTVDDASTVTTSAPAGRATPIEDGHIDGTYDTRYNNGVESHPVSHFATSSHGMDIELAGAGSQFEDRIEDRLIEENTKRPAPAFPRMTSWSSVANDSPATLLGLHADPRPLHRTTDHVQSMEEAMRLPISEGAQSDTGVRSSSRNFLRQDGNECTSSSVISTSMSAEAKLEAIKVDLSRRLERISSHTCSRLVTARWAQIGQASSCSNGTDLEWLESVEESMLWFLSEVHKRETTGFCSQRLDNQLSNLRDWEAHTGYHAGTAQDAPAAKARATEPYGLDTLSELPIDRKGSKKMSKPRKVAKSCKHCISDSPCWRHRTEYGKRKLVAEVRERMEKNDAETTKDSTTRETCSPSAAPRRPMSEHLTAPDAQQSARHDGTASVPISGTLAISRRHPDP